MIRRLPKETNTAVKPAETMQDVKPVNKVQDANIVADKKAGDEAIELTREEFTKVIRLAIHEELEAAGLIKPVEEPIEEKPEDKKDDVAEEAKEETKEEEAKEDETPLDNLPEDAEVAELDEKVEDADSEELGKLLADPKKKEAIKALLKDSAIDESKKATDSAASKFVTRYDDFNTEKPVVQPTKPNRYE